jgi:uncharacterized protein (DUF1800 family)
MRSFCNRRLRLAAVAILLTGAAGAAALGASKPPSAVPAHPDDRTILHVLNRIGFGARPGDVDRVRQTGLEAYIDRQLHPERIPDADVAARLTGFSTLTKSTREIAEEFFIPAQQARVEAKREDATKESAAGGNTSSNQNAKPERTPEQMEAARRQREVLAELSEQKILRAVFSERQLEEVMTDFWFNHFNVFAGKGATQVYLTEYERDVIRPHAFGKFRDLLEATATSPAMLFYLDNWQSADPNAEARNDTPRMPRGGAFGNPFGRAGRPPIMFPPAPRPQQNPNAQRPKRGLNENYGRELMELHTLGVDGGYTQDDVVAVARCFTGWTIAEPRRGGGFRFEPKMHDPGEKIVLGHKIKAGGGREDGEKVLDILATHPSTARFISTKLARRFVSDTPPASLVDRAAARFRETDGDIREVLRTILTSPEFFAAEAYRAKIKTPFEFVVSAVRATGSNVVSALPLVQTVRQLGMPLYFCQPPTGYADRAEAWVNTGALLNRMNFAVAMVNGRLRGIQPSIDTASRDSALPVSLVASVLASDISPATESTLAKAKDPQQVAALTLGSPEFQRR